MEKETSQPREINSEPEFRPGMDSSDPKKTNSHLSISKVKKIAKFDSTMLLFRKKDKRPNSQNSNKTDTSVFTVISKHSIPNDTARLSETSDVISRKDFNKGTKSDTQLKAFEFDKGRKKTKAGREKKELESVLEVT